MPVGFQTGPGRPEKEGAIGYIPSSTPRRRYTSLYNQLLSLQTRRFPIFIAGWVPGEVIAAHVYGKERPSFRYKLRRL